MFGTYDGHVSPLVPLSQATLVDLAFAGAGTATLTLPAGQLAFVLMAAGEVAIAGHKVTRASGLAFGQDMSERMMTVQSDAAARLALYLGTPIREPVVWDGPFVMTSVEDIQQARRDYVAGKMGRM